MRGELSSVSSRVVAGITVSFTVLGATAITLAAYSAYAMRPAPLPTSLAISAFTADAQISNRAAKASKLASVAPALATSGAAPADVLAATPPAEALRPAEPVTAEAPAVQPAAWPKLASLGPAPLPHEKPRHLLPPPPPAPVPAPQASNGVLDDAQIAGLRGRLRLSSDQVAYWPAVEEALRDVARTHLRGLSSKITRGGRLAIDVNSPEVQKLIWAAMPLLARLREDQKTEVRKLARVIGLEQVASQI
jgi:hypothetical protein